MNTFGLDRAVIQHIWKTCELFPIKDCLTTLYESNATCITQIKEDYMKCDKLSTIHPNSFIHMSSKKVVILMSSRYNQVKIMHNIGMRWLKDLFIIDNGSFT